MWGPGQATGAICIYGESLFHPDLLWAFAALLAALLAGALAIAWISRWRKQRPDGGLSVEEQLSRFRNMQKQGELSAAEFESIRLRLEQKNAKPAAATPQGPLGTSSS